VAAYSERVMASPAFIENLIVPYVPKLISDIRDVILTVTEEGGNKGCWVPAQTLSTMLLLI
jgi:hypothetical protein